MHFDCVCKNLGNVPENLEKTAEGVGMGGLMIILRISRNCCVWSDVSAVEFIFAGHWEKGNNSLLYLHEQGSHLAVYQSRGFGEK